MVNEKLKQVIDIIISEYDNCKEYATMYGGNLTSILDDVYRRCEWKFNSLKSDAHDKQRAIEKETQELIEILTDDSGRLPYCPPNTIVVNLIGGPCCGKSTTAAGIFYCLKRLGIECELVDEYAKDRVWENSTDTLSDQIYVFGKQYHKMWKLNNKVKVIIMDSPILLSTYYSKVKSKYFQDFIIEQFKMFYNVNFVLDRGSIPFVNEGRVNDEKESNQIDKFLCDIMDKYNIEYTRVNASNAVETIVRKIKELL